MTTPNIKCVSDSQRVFNTRPGHRSGPIVQQKQALAFDGHYGVNDLFFSLSAGVAGSPEANSETDQT